MKKILFVLAIIIVVSIAMLWLLPRFVSFNNYKTQISNILSEKTGLDVKINGDISLTILPEVGVVVQDLTITGKPAQESVEHVSFHTDTFLLKLKLLPLFKQSVEFDSIVLKKPDAEVILAGAKTKKTKTTNSNTVAKVGEKQDQDIVLQPETEVGAKKLEPKEAVATKVALNDFQIEDAQLLIKGEDLKEPISIGHLNSKITLINQEMAIKMDGKLYQKGQDFPLHLDGNVIFEDQHYKADKFNVSVGEVKADGMFDADMRDQLPHVNLVLNIGKMDLNPFISTHKSASTTEKAAQKDNKESADKVFKWSNKALPFNELKRVNIHADIQIAEVTYEELKIEELVSNIRLREGQLGLTNKMKLADGSINHQASIDVTGKLPRIKHEFEVAGIQVTQLPVSSLQKGRFSGKANLSLQVQATGNNQLALIRSASGSGKINVQDGQIKGINLEDVINLQPGTALNVKQSDTKTEFKQIDASFTIESGILANQDLVIDTGRFRLDGMGIVNLPELLVDYRVTPHADVSDVSKRNVNLDIGVVVRGPLSNPLVRVDLTKTLEKLITNPDDFKGLLKDIKKGIKEKNSDTGKDLKDNLKEGFKNLLQGQGL